MVLLADGKISLRDSDDQHVLQIVPYADVISISYSRGPHPLWNGPAGPTMVSRVGFAWLGRGDRHWVSLRLRGGNSFIVLRLAGATDAARAFTALAERTGRKIEFVDQKSGA